MAFQSSRHHLLKRLSFLHCMFFGSFVRNYLPTYMWVYFWALNLFLWSVYFFCQYHTVLILWLCSIILGQRVWVHSVYSGLLWLFGVFVILYKFDYFCCSISFKIVIIRTRIKIVGEFVGKRNNCLLLVGM